MASSGALSSSVRLCLSLPSSRLLRSPPLGLPLPAPPRRLGAPAPDALELAVGGFAGRSLPVLSPSLPRCLACVGFPRPAVVARLSSPHFASLRLVAASCPLALSRLEIHKATLAFPGSKIGLERERPSWPPGHAAQLVHDKDRRFATLIMTDNSVEETIERLWKGGEPTEWRGRGPPTFILWPTSREERTQNFQRFLTGYPRIVVAADKGGTLRYHCAICRRGATMMHILTDYRIGKACHDFSASLGRSIPEWMARFQSVDTTAGDLFDEDEYDLWPPVCNQCNANLMDPSSCRCSFCRPSTMPASAT